MKKFIIYSAGLTGIVFSSKFVDCFQLPKLIFIFIFTFFVYIYLFIYEKKFKSFRNDIFFIPIFAFVLWRIVSLKNCTNIYSGIYNILILIFFITLYYGLINFFENEEEIKIFFKSFAFSSIVISIYGILQVFGIDIIDWQIKYTALSTLGRRNFAGEYIVMGIPYVYCLFALSYKKEKILYSFILLLLFLHLILTFTRASYIAFFFSSLFFVFLLKKKKIEMSKKILIIILFFLLINKGICGIKAFEKGTFKTRFIIWKNSLKIIKENPVFGIGPGNFEIVFPSYTRENSEFFQDERIKDVHNDMIEVGVESGTIGMVTFIFLILYPFYIFFKNKKFYIVPVSIITSLLALYINSLASFPFKRYSTLFLFWCNLSFLSILYGKRDKKESKYHKFSLIYFIIFSLTSFILIIRGSMANYFISNASKGINIIEYTEKGVKANPFSFEFNFFAGNVEYFYGNNLEKSIFYYEKAKYLFPNYYKLYNNLGIVYFQKRDYKRAEENYLKAIYLNPKNHEAYNNLGSLYIETGKYEQAIPYLLKCIEISPSFYVAYFNLGMAYYLKNDYKKAREYFEKTLKIKPDFKPAKDMIYKNEKNIHN